MNHRKNFVVDTNVIIYDPNVLKGLGDNNILIPLPVLEEVDSLKKGKSDRARSSREFIRQLEEIRTSNSGNLHEGIETGNFFIQVLTDVPTKNAIPEILDSEKVDNHILKMCSELDNPVLITKDVSMRIKADALGIASEDYKNSQVSIKDHYNKFRKELLSPDSYTVSWDDIADTHVWDINKDLGAYENEFLYLGPEDDPDGEDFLVRNICGEFHTIIPQTIFGIDARNNEQAALIDVLTDEEIHCVAAVGKAGTGKTLIALACGLEQVLETGKYEKVVIARPTVAMDDDIGYLPGGIDEKMDPWLGPIYDNVEFLFKAEHMQGRKGLDDLKYHDLVEVQPLSYIRGRSISNRFIIIDESQNLSPLQIKTIVTRVGQNSKIVLTGDPYQIDNPYLDTSSNGLTHLVNGLRGEEIFASVVLHATERSELAELAANLL